MSRFLKNYSNTLVKLFLLSVFASNYVGAEPGDDLDVTVAKSSTGAVYCHARTNAADLAFTFTRDGEDMVDQQGEISSIQGKLLCDLDAEGDCQSWRLEGGWTVVSSLEVDVPPITDVRWERIKVSTIRKVDGVTESVPTNAYNISFSVKGSDDAFVFLAAEERPERSDNHYLIIIGGWDNIRAALRRRRGGNYNFIRPAGWHAAGSGTFLNSNEWRHFWLSYQEQTVRLGSLAPYQEIFTYVERRDPIDVKYSSFGLGSYGTSPLSWKLISKKFFYLGKHQGGTANGKVVGRIHIPIQREGGESPTSFSFWYMISPHSGVQLNIYTAKSNEPYVLLERIVSERNQELAWKHKVTELQSHRDVIMIEGVIPEKSPTSSIVVVDDVRSCVQNKEACDSTERKFTPGENQLNGSSTVFCRPVFRSVVNESAKCDRECSNGGSCRGDGVCLCPPGFNGDHCQLGCGRSLFGNDCKGTCSLDNDCKGFTLCRASPPTLCSCASGYRNLYRTIRMSAQCQASCRLGSYGPGCRQECGNCSGSESCDIYTGNCPGGCQPGYAVPVCKLTYPYLKIPPSLASEPRLRLLELSIPIHPAHFGGEGSPAQFQVQFKRVDNTTSTWTEGKWQRIAGYDNHTQYLLSGLRPDTEYSVRVVLRTSDGNMYAGDRIPLATYKTSCNFPSPPSGVSINEDSVTSQSITVTWINSAPEDDCRISGYMISITSVRFNGTAAASGPPAVIGGLSPYTEYEIRVMGVVDNSTYTAPSEPAKATTKLAAPGQVQNIRLTSQTNVSLQMSWDPPNVPNGRVRHYIVTYWLYARNSCRPQIVPPKEMTKSTNTTQETSYTLSDLRPYSLYGFEVAAYTVEEGNRTRNYFNTLPGVPEAAPLSDSKEPEYDARRRTLTFRWKAPDCRLWNGPIHYRTQLTSPDPWTTQVEEPTDTNELQQTVRDVIPYTTYTLTVFLVNAKNEGRELEIKAKRLPPSAPPAVRNLTVYSKSRSQISVRWARPWPPHGELEGYDLNARRRSQCITLYCDNKEYTPPEPCVLWDDLFCSTILELREYGRYKVQITARNLGVNAVGQISETDIITTEEEEPGPPSSLTITAKTANLVRLSVGHPDILNGIMDKFIIAILKFDGYSEPRVEVIPAREPSRTYDYEIVGLESSTTYRIAIHAKTGAGIGPLITRIISTPPTEPIISQTLQIDYRSAQNSSVGLVVFPVTLDEEADSSCFVIVIPQSGREGGDSGLSPDSNLADTFKEIIKEPGFYIAMEISEENLAEARWVEVGSGEQSKGSNGEYSNMPLLQGVYYTFGLVCISEYDGEIRHASNFTDGDFYLGNEPLGTDGDERDGTENEGTSVGVIAGITLAVIVIIIIIGAIPLHICKKWSGKESTSGESIHLPVYFRMMDETAAIEERRFFSEHDNEAANQSMMASEILELHNHSLPVKMTDLEKYVEYATDSGRLKKQYEVLPKGQAETSQYGKRPENILKNRFTDLLPYEHSRVVLEEIPGERCSDYINANYVPGYKAERAYIATQAPKTNTVVDLWRMVWQENVGLIVNLTGLEENGKRKCVQYWPDKNKSEIYGDINVRWNKNATLQSDYAIRHFTVQHCGEERQLIHAHFTTWPDHRVPSYSQSFASFYKKLSLIPPGPGPTIVHCTAGVGNTGTFILVDTLFKMATAVGSVDFPKQLGIMRQNRLYLVDNYEQYKFAYVILCEILFEENCSVPCSEFKSRFQLLKDVAGSAPQMEIERQYKMLEKKRGKMLADQKDCSSEMKELTREPSLCPPGLIAVSSANQPILINAVSVNSYQQKDRFIATQLPLPHTQHHFWHVVYEKMSPAVVILQQPDPNNEDTPVFWPANDQVISHGHLRLEAKKETTEGNITRRIILLKNSIKMFEKPREICLLHLLDWEPNFNLPQEKTSLLSMYNCLEKVPSSGGPITVACYDGASACGLFAGVFFIFDKMKLEHEADVYLAVETVRWSNPHFIRHMDQYKHCYDCALAFLESFGTYANFQ